MVGGGEGMAAEILVWVLTVSRDAIRSPWGRLQRGRLGFYARLLSPSSVAGLTPLPWFVIDRWYSRPERPV
jgi:hypothetical protein